VNVCKRNGNYFCRYGATFLAGERFAETFLVAGLIAFLVTALAFFTGLVGLSAALVVGVYQR
jgi:hypothetical protein